MFNVELISNFRRVRNFSPRSKPLHPTGIIKLAPQSCQCRCLLWAVLNINLLKAVLNTKLLKHYLSIGYP
jgi:hypothetical protein